MKVICTLDYIDGRKSKTRTLDIEQVDTSFLRLTMMQQGVAGITITNVHRLEKLAKALDETTKDET